MRHSSGGSLELEDTSAHNHLVDWKNELASNGGLSSGVVRIETDYGRPIEELYDGVHDGEILGTGISGVVRKVKHKTTGVEYAVKCLDLGLIRDERGLKALKDEVFIMCQLDHPNIVRLEEVYESDTEIYFIQELCVGGDLFDRLEAQQDYHYTEAECARVIKQMLSSVRYLHSKNIIHRDLKLENFLFSSKDANSTMKMIDFGLSKHFTFIGEVQHESVGTPYTVAPEVIRADYDEKIDIWALGVIIFLLLSGETPFGGADGEDLQTVRTNILSGKVVFEPAELWEHVSDEGKAFVKRLLNPKSCVRPTATEAQLDPWLQTFGKNGTDEGTKINPKLIKALVEFREYSDIRKALCEVLSFTLLPEQIAEMQEDFEKIDSDGDGEISLEEFKQVLAQKAEGGVLGPLTEVQLDDLFNTLRLKKSNKSIRWHEFIAASLSQCNFDERNLRLAFDRLDYDRTGFITFDDVKDLFGSSEHENEEMKTMWQEGMTEYACQLGRITYDDFRMILKGRGREVDQPSCVKRQSIKKVHEGSPLLQAVPEGSISPQVNHDLFSKFDNTPPSFPSLKMPTLQSHPESKPSVNILYPAEIPNISKTFDTYKRTRSGSLGNVPVSKLSIAMIHAEAEGSSELSMQLLSSRSLDAPASPRRESWSDGELNHTCETFKKHNDFTMSVLKASRTFEAKVLERKLRIAASTQANQPMGNSRASLIMRREVKTKRPDTIQVDARQKSDSASSNLPDNRQASANEVEDASRRGGRPRRERRKRTTSDISGMLK